MLKFLVVGQFEIFVMPAEAGIQGFRALDSRLRGNDG
jgi:hypothetical protein